VSRSHTLDEQFSLFFLNALGELLAACVPLGQSVSVNCKLLQPVVAMPKDGRASVTIPAGTLVEVRPRLHKGGLAEVLWEGESFSAQLDDLRGGIMSQRAFRLNASTIAVWSAHGRRTLVAIPAHAVVSVILGDLEGDGAVKIRYQDRVLTVFADDLRRAEPAIAPNA
jgi:hypothetical protein